MKNKFSSFSVDDKSSTSVTVNIYLRSINDIDDYKMEFSVQVTFREQWNDERLKFDNFEGCKITQENSYSFNEKSFSLFRYFQIPDLNRPS